MNLKRLIQLLSASLTLASIAEDPYSLWSNGLKEDSYWWLGSTTVNGHDPQILQKSREEEYYPRVFDQAIHDKFEPNHHASRLLPATTSFGSNLHSETDCSNVENVEEYGNQELDDGPTDSTYASTMILYSSMALAPVALIGLTVYIVMTHGKKPEESQFGEMQA